MRSFGFSSTTVVCGWTERVSQTFEPITRVVADHGRAAEDRGVGINHDAVFDRRMALLPADQIAVAVGGEAERPERHALIELDAVADLARLADHDARAVVDEEVLADLRAGMDVDPGARIGPIRSSSAG